MSENRVKKALLSIGSNLGNKINNIEKAKFLLNSSNSIKILKVSSYYKIESWPDKSKPFFLNIVLQISTTFEPLNLFNYIKKIEKSLGRKKTMEMLLTGESLSADEALKYGLINKCVSLNQLEYQAT